MKKLRYKFEIFKSGFTLAEVLITLVIIGVVAALTIPTVISKIEERDTVAKVQKAYSTIAQAWEKFQVDNGCTGTFEGCFSGNQTRKKMHENFLKYFNYVEWFPPGTLLNDVDWISETAYHLNGTVNSQQWMGVHKGVASSVASLFTLADGTVYHLEMPDGSYGKCGYIFVDTNGAKGPNRIGKDQFPIGIGAYENPEYDGIVHPFYNEDSTNGYGLCNIRNNGQCSADTCTQSSCSPTAYVLKNKKLPPITW